MTAIFIITNVDIIIHIVIVSSDNGLKLGVDKTAQILMTVIIIIFSVLFFLLLWHAELATFDSPISGKEKLFKA